MHQVNLKKILCNGIATGLLFGAQLAAEAAADKAAATTTNAASPAKDAAAAKAEPAAAAKESAAGKTTTNTQSKSDDLLTKMEQAKGGNFGYHLFSDEEMQLELTPAGLEMYNSLNEEGKHLARVVASNRCGGDNECNGLNSCKTDKNDCAGQGQCKGQSKCAVATKDLAVKLVANRMAKQRAEVLPSAKSPAAAKASDNSTSSAKAVAPN